MKKPLYLALVELIGRKHRLSQPGGDAAMLRHVEKVLDDLCKEHLPPGSGYDGWTCHTVKVTSAWQGFNLTVTGRDRDGIKDFIGDTFHNCLMREVEYDAVPRESAA